MKLKGISTDIRLWILIFFILRLYEITNPPLEVSHNWRQTTVTMVSRNFLEQNNNILYPRIDIAGEKTGITGMEFPLLNYLIYLISELFGYEHWYGRLINLIVSSIGIWFFYFSIRKFFEEKVAFCSAIVLSVSIWFQFSRKIMPDTFAMSMIIAGIYFGLSFFENKKNEIRNLICYLLLIVAGMLSKLPSGYLLIIFGIVLFNSKIHLKKKIVFSSVTILALVPVLLWYFYWVPFLVKEYGFWHFFMGKDIFQGTIEIANNFPLTLKRFYDTPLKYVGFIVFIVGLIASFYKRQKLLIAIFISAFFGFLIVILKAGFTFVHHSYYIVPFVPVMALITGYCISEIKNKRIAFSILFLISFESVFNQLDDFRINVNERRIIGLEKDLDQFSTRSDLILINSGNYPTPMYFSHRKGWVDSNERIADKKYQKELIEKGLKYIVILKSGFGTEMNPGSFRIMLDSPDYTIYGTK